MKGRYIALSRPRRFVGDLIHLAARVPTVPVQRRMDLTAVAVAREQTDPRVCWPAVFLKAYAAVADEMPVLRRAYLGLPWPHLREYPLTVAALAVERDYHGEPGVFFARISDPARMPLAAVHRRVRELAEVPVESVPSYRKQLRLAGWPRPVRRSLLWLGLNLPRTRPGQFGTFALSTYSSTGAESLHPLSPLTTALNYGVIQPGRPAWVRLVYDHRVFDGATAARALACLEHTLTGPIVDELRSYTSIRPTRRDAA